MNSTSRLRFVITAPVGGLFGIDGLPGAHAAAANTTSAPPQQPAVIP